MSDKPRMEQIEIWYFFSIAVMNIQGKTRVTFELSQPIMDEQIIVQILDDLGFKNSPEFNELIQTAKEGWTLDKLNQLVRFLPASATVMEMDFAKVFINADNPSLPKKREPVLVISPFFKNPNRIKPDSYRLPFVVLGRYVPYITNWQRINNQAYKFITSLRQKINDFIYP